MHMILSAWDDVYLRRGLMRRPERCGVASVSLLLFPIPNSYDACLSNLNWYKWKESLP